MSALVLQVRVPEDTLNRIDAIRGGDTRSAWLQRLIDRELAGPQRAEEGLVKTSSTPPASALGAIGAGEPSPGVACAGPGCWQRNTSRFGLRKVPLCPACRAALEGRTHQRETPPGAARLMRRGAA